MEEIDLLLELDPLPDDVEKKIEALIKTAPSGDRAQLRTMYGETLHLLQSDGSESLLIGD